MPTIRRPGTSRRVEVSITPDEEQALEAVTKSLQELGQRTSAADVFRKSLWLAHRFIKQTAKHYEDQPQTSRDYIALCLQQPRV